MNKNRMEWLGGSFRKFQKERNSKDKPRVRGFVLFCLFVSVFKDAPFVEPITPGDGYPGN